MLSACRYVSVRRLRDCRRRWPRQPPGIAGRPEASRAGRPARVTNAPARVTMGPARAASAQSGWCQARTRPRPKPREPGQLRPPESDWPWRGGPRERLRPRRDRHLRPGLEARRPDLQATARLARCPESTARRRDRWPSMAQRGPPPAARLLARTRLVRWPPELVPPLHPVACPVLARSWAAPVAAPPPLASRPVPLICPWLPAGRRPLAGRL